MYAAIPGAVLDSAYGGYVYPAGAAVPDVALAVGGATYTLRAGDFALGEAGAGMLFGGIQSRGDNPFDILGDGACIRFVCCLGMRRLIGALRWCWW